MPKCTQCSKYIKEGKFCDDMCYNIRIAESVIENKNRKLGIKELLDN